MLIVRWCANQYVQYLALDISRKIGLFNYVLIYKGTFSRITLIFTLYLYSCLSLSVRPKNEASTPIDRDRRRYFRVLYIK